MRAETSRAVFSEFLGTAGLLIAVVGSGIMGETLAPGHPAVALLANSLATGGGLYALIQTFGDSSGAHFNPVVSGVEFLWGRLTARELALYIFAQVGGAITGVIVTHVLFGQKLLQISGHDRGNFRYAVSEVVATFGLITVIALSGRKRPDTVPGAIACYVASAYWFTSSSAFANPAVTIARGVTDTFSGIQPAGIPLFIGAQIVGGALGYLISRWYGAASSE